jgi:hypothetical protein
MYQKKVISKNVTFTHVRQTCFAYNFFLCIFSQLFQREIQRILTPFLIKKKLSNFEAKRARNSSKNQKTYLVNVS